MNRFVWTSLRPSAPAFLAASFFILLPPWRAQFHSIEGDIPNVVVALPWPKPDFKYGALPRLKEHDFPLLVPIWTPPRPGPEIIGGNFVGVWSTSIDFARLYLFLILSVVTDVAMRGIWSAFRTRKST